MMLDSNATATAAPNYRHQPPSSLNHRSASLLALDQLGHHHLPKSVGSSKLLRKSPAAVAMSSRIPMDSSSPQLRRPIGSGSMADISNSYHYPPPPPGSTTSRHHPATPTTRFGDFVQDFPSSPIINRTGQTKAGPRRNGHLYHHQPQQLAHPNQRLSASTMAIPTLLASPPQFFPSTPPPQKLKPSSARNSPRNSRNQHNNKNPAISSISSSLSNSNFILRKSKLNLYDSTTMEPTDQFPDTSADNCHVRQRTNFNADPNDDSDLDISEDDQPQSVGLSPRSPTCHQSLHPQSPDLQNSSIRSFPYSPIAASKQYHAHQLPSPSGNSSSSSSWLGWLSPKFSSVSPSSAAKSASLSYHHLKQVEPDSGFDYSLVPEPVSYRSTVQPDYDQSFLSQSLPYRDRSNSEQPAQPSSINPIVLIPTPTALHSPNATNTTTTTINTSTFFASSARHSQSQSLAQHYSSSSGCSTQSSASSAASFSRSLQKREAAQNFRDFVQHYERGLLECLSSVEQKAAASTAAAAAQQPQSSTVQLQEQQHPPPPPTIEPLSSDGDGMQSTAAAVCRPRLSSTSNVNREDTNSNSSSSFERHYLSFHNPLSPNSKSLDTSLSSNANDLHHHHSNHISNRMSPISTTTTTNYATEAGEDLKKKKSSNLIGNKGNCGGGDNGTPVKLPTSNANNNDNEWSASNDLNDNQLSALAVTTTANATNATNANGGASLNSVLECQSLRLQLAKVRALRDQYETGFKCSEALEKIMKLTKSRECDREWRANERLLADIEKQLEAMIGTIRICVEDLEGWARICPRDNYEIEFRHDKQRRTLRVHIGKALERIWDSGRQEVEFRGALKPSVACRVKEIKSRWHVMALGRRNVTLGVTSISMSELLVSVSKGRPILLDANASGSLKLRIRCSWQPTLISPEDYQNSLNSSGKSRSNTADSSNTGPETGTFSSTYTSSSSAIAPMDDPSQSFRSALSCPQSNRRSFDSSTFIDHPASNSLTPVQCSNSSDGFNSLLTAKVNRNSSSVSSISNVDDSNSNCSRRKPPSSQNRYSSGGDLLSPPSPHSPTMGSSHSGSPSHNFPSGQQSQFGLRKELARSLLALPSNFDHNLHQQQPNSPSSPTTSAQQSRRFQYSQLPPPPKSDPSYSKGSSFSSSSSDSLELVVSAKSPSSHSSPTTTNVAAIPSSIQLKVQQIDQLLCSLQSAMEDYRGQFVELALMSSSVERLLQYLCDHFDCPSSRHPSTSIRPNSLVTGPSQICGPDDLDDDNDFDKVEEMLAYGDSKGQEETFSEIEDALAQFDFLDCETDSSTTNTTTFTKTPNDKHSSNKSNKPSSARKDYRRPTNDHGGNSGPLGAPHKNGRLNCSTTGSRPVYGEDCVDSDEECDDDDDGHSKPIIIASYEMPGLGNQQQTSLLPKTQHNNHHNHNHRQQQLNYNNNNNNNRSRSSSKTRQIRPGGKPDRLQTTSDDALLTTELTNGDDCAITTTLPLASREVSDHSKSSWSNSVDPLPPTAQKSSRCCRDPTIAIRNVDQWSAVLILHLQSAIQQLAHVGSWMLKGRETQALERLRADSFAFEQIHHIFESSSALPPDPSLPLGNDPRVLQLWNLLEVSTINTGTSLANSSSRNSVSLPTGDPSMVDGQPGYQARRAHRRHPFILSWRQLSSLLIELMYKFGLGRNQYSDDDLEDNIRNSCEWLSSLIVPVSQTKVTLFDLRAFFELNLWQSTSRTSQSLFNEPGGGGGGGHSDLSLRSMFQIALDVNQLMRKCKKLSFARLEEILFDRFSINASWIPADVTLTIVHYLYENYNHDRSSKLTTSEVKKWDRLREICKIGTNWLIWLLQDGHRYEIREHVLAGLESGSASTRRASCYGIMYIFKMLKRNQAELAKNQSAEHRAKSATGNGSQAANHQSSFYGQEMDSLLYVSMEDQDGRVREEARKALKCLGHYAQQRLSQMERSRMGFFGGMGHTSRSAMASAIIGGQSMPNLNRI